MPIQFYWLNLLGVVRFQTEGGLLSALTWRWSREVRQILYMIAIDITDAEPLVWAWGLTSPDVNEDFLVLGLAGGFNMKPDMAAILGNIGNTLSEKLLEDYRKATQHGLPEGGT